MMDQSAQPDAPMGTPTNQHIASYIWNSGHLSVAFYNTTSLELFVTYEAVDLKPDFWNLKNHFRQIEVSTVLASGPTVFLKAIMQLLDLPESADPHEYRITRAQPMTAAEFVVYMNNEKTLRDSRRRIFELRLPGMKPHDSDKDRHNFIETILPLNQTLMVQCLGNLLNYLDSNWKQLFLRTDRNPIITDISIFQLNSQVLIDESTFCALQVFAPRDHPSAFKKSSHGSLKEGLSLYSIMNTCVSRIGSNTLRMMLQQPTRDLEELNLRHDTIEWCRKDRNSLLTGKFQTFLRGICNIGELFAKLVASRGKPALWKTFQRAIHHGHMVGVICADLVQTKPQDVQNTVLEQLGKFTLENQTIEGILQNMNVIIDLEESLKNGKFCVNFGLDTELDQKKEKLMEVLQILTDTARREIINSPDFVRELTVHFVHEMGFLIAIPAWSNGNLHPSAISIENLTFVHKTNDAFYFKSPLCEEHTKNYGHLYAEISERELQICDRFLEHIRENLNNLQFLTKMCAQMDCLLAMAKFAVVHQLIRPTLETEEKLLEIVEGRHLILNLNRKFISNSTSISAQEKNLINILIAPNASGKSVYLKEVAQIVYLAHVGSFVPAKTARISIVDAIFTRIYNPETLYSAKSSFLIEIQQMGNVMTNSTSNSLILIDELGQGTNVLDGQALLRSCLEHLISRGAVTPMTILTTHYTNIYDEMIDREWVRLKTFKMLRNADGTASSTYKLYEGKGEELYVRDCAEVKHFLERTLGLNGDIAKNANDNNATGIVNIVNEVYEAKVKCAASLLIEFCKGSSNLVDIFEGKRI